MFILSQVHSSTFHKFLSNIFQIARALIIKFILRNKNAYCSSLSSSPSLPYLFPFPPLLSPILSPHSTYPIHNIHKLSTYHLSLFTHHTQLVYFIFFFFSFFLFFLFLPLVHSLSHALPSLSRTPSHPPSLRSPTY